MDIDKLHIAAQRPALYEKGDSIIWTDEHISKKLLELHLNPNVDSASRSQESIDHTMEFLLSFCKKSPMTILDLGCGPGIYLEKLAELGHHCTGIDFSMNSISYAREKAKKKGLDIRYINQNYLELDFAKQFDLVIMICEGAFPLMETDEMNFQILANATKALKKDGKFIFTTLNGLYPLFHSVKDFLNQESITGVMSRSPGQEKGEMK